MSDPMCGDGPDAKYCEVFWSKSAECEALHAERDGLTDRIAGLIGELNAVRVERDELRAHSNALAEDLDDAGATIADYRDALTAMQCERDNLRELATEILTEVSAWTVIRADLKQIAKWRERAEPHAPAITGAGAEHLARQLLDPGNPDAWQRVADMPAEGR